MDGPVENFLGPPAAQRGGGPGAGAGRRAAPGRGARAEAPRLRPHAVRAADERNDADLHAGCRPRRRCGARRRRRSGGRGQATPEQIAAQQAAADELRKWRTSVSLDRVRDVKKLYNDAGVTIYAYKPDGMQKNMQTTDGEFDYVFSIAAALGASHLTMELPGGETAIPLMKRLVQFAEKHKVPVAYHTARAGQHDGLRRGAGVVEVEHDQRRSRPLRRRGATSGARRSSSSSGTTRASRASI